MYIVRLSGYPLIQDSLTCIIQIRMYFADLYVSLLDQISDGVEASLDEFGLYEKSGFLRQGNCSKPCAVPEGVLDYGVSGQPDYIHHPDY